MVPTVVVVGVAAVEDVVDAGERSPETLVKFGGAANEIMKMLTIISCHTK